MITKVNALSENLLKVILQGVLENDTNYEVRNELTYKAVGLAGSLGYEVGFRIDPNEPEWPVCYIELPTGQVSWHMPQHVNPWDGHDTDEKIARVSRYIHDEY